MAHRPMQTQSILLNILQLILSCSPTFFYMFVFFFGLADCIVELKFVLVADNWVRIVTVILEIQVVMEAVIMSMKED